MNLYIDTSNNLITLIKLDNQEFLTNYDSPRDQDAFGAIKRALDSTGKTIQDITSVEFNKGPGSFTGLRVGASIANTLSLTLNIPINGQAPGTVIEPTYGAPPSITMPKKK